MMYATVENDEKNITDFDDDLADEANLGTGQISHHPESLKARPRKCGIIRCFLWSATAFVVLYIAGTIILLTSRYPHNDPPEHAITTFDKMLILPNFLQSLFEQESGNELIVTESNRNGNDIVTNLYRYDENETITSLDTTIVHSDDFDTDVAVVNSLVASSNLTRAPDVAWIMSFGGSGTSYTIVNTEIITNATTASNYGEDYIPCVSIDSRKNGPYIRSLDKGLPEKYILTKTHCGGYCMDCPPGSYLHSLESFEVSCRTGTKRRSTGRVVTTIYSADIPKRIVHLIRNPFDNIIGRMHLSAKHKISRNNDGSVDDNDDNKCRNDEACLTEWCHYLDTTYAKAEYDSKIFHPLYSKYHNVPCHSEWFRYIQWHNYAFQVHSEIYKNVPVHYLYYDNYTTNFNETVRMLYSFLEFPMEQIMQHDPYPFISSGKSYMKLFDLNHATAGRNMTRDLAHPAVWNLIKHYFDQYYTEYNQTALVQKPMDPEDALEDGAIQKDIAGEIPSTNDTLMKDSNNSGHRQ